jgi:hypothetical protein
MKARLLGGLAGAAALALASQGHALTVVASFDPSITGLANAAVIEATVNQAAAFYSQFTNPVTVNINFNDMSNGLGGSETGLYADFTPNYVNALTANSAAHPENDVLTKALANMSNANNKDLVVGTSADFRALGYDAPGVIAADGSCCSGPFDGLIFLNTSIMYFGAPVVGEYDALATIQHEIDEVLGIGGPGTLVDQPFGPDLSGFSYMGAEDLYRYNGPHSPSFTTDPNEHAYFSIDGGVTDLHDFNQNGLGDFADWAKTHCLGANANVQDWAGCSFPHDLPVELDRHSVEVTGLQAIGYNLSVPEPATWALMIGGFGLAGAGLRRRRMAVATA